MATKPPTRYVKWYNSMVHPSNLAAFCSAIISDHRKGQPGPRRFSGCVPATCGLAAPAGGWALKNVRPSNRISKYQNPWVRRWLWFCVFLVKRGFQKVSFTSLGRRWKFGIQLIGWNLFGGRIPSAPTIVGSAMWRPGPHVFSLFATAERVPWHSPPSRPQSWSSLAAETYVQTYMGGSL